MARAFLILIVACGGSETHTQAVPIGSPAADTQPEVDVSWLGGRALVEVIIRPDRWPEVRDAARDLVAERSIPNDLERLLSTATFEEALALVTRDARIGLELPGLDRDRAVLARLFEPAESLTFGNAMEVAKGNIDDRLMHHWVFLPTTDAAALTSALIDRMSERCEREASRLRCREHTVAVLTADDWVVLAIDTDALPQRGGTDHMTWALGHPAAAHVRFDVMQELAPYMGAVRVAQALRAVDPAFHDEMMLVATSELLGAHLHLQPWMEELDSITVALSTEPAGFVGSARMTQRGAAIPLREATATTAAAAPLVVRTGFDLEAARRGSPTISTLVLYDTPTEAMHAMSECGMFCFQHAFSMPFSVARMLREGELLSTEEIAYVVDAELGPNEVVLEAQVDQLPGGLRELGRLFPQARLHARRTEAHWIGALGFPETPSIAGLATPNARVATRTPSSDEETRCIVEMTLEAVTVLETIPRIEASQRSRAVQEVTTLRDTLGTRCGRGERASAARDAVRAALAVIPAP